MVTEMTNTEILTNANNFQEANIFKAKIAVPSMMSKSVHLTKGNNRNSGISLPKAFIAKIDAVKHPDVPRSKFVLRILEAALMQQEQNYNK